jgi:hypothetical protein
MFHGQPKLDAADVDNVGGAYINCYVHANSLGQAEKISRKDIRKMKWEILEQEEAYELDADSVSDEGREYYEQALIDKTVYILHTYPIEEN